MKKNVLLFITISVILISCFTACKKDYTAPVITFNSGFGDQKISAGDNVTIKGSITAPGEFSSIVFNKDGELYQIATDFNEGKTNYDFSITIPADEITETFEFQVQVTDKQENSKTTKEQVTIIVDDLHITSVITISFDNGYGNQTIEAGQNVTIKGTAYANCGLHKITYLKDEGEYGDAVTTFDTDTTHNFSITIPADVITETFNFTVKVTDKNEPSETSTESITITVNNDETITTHNVTLGDQNDVEGGFLDLLTNTVYTNATAQANESNISFLYYWGATGNASFYSPQGAVDAGIYNYGNIGNWTVRQTTKFKLDYTADYDNITYDELTAATANISDQSETNLETGDLVFFKTDSGHCGLIKVGNIVPGKGTLEITLEYKIQDVAPTK
ncbi:MAG: hypothetical protein K8R54_06170 [Bacteroidales bacterium]|nr:hypothetical protein [Bacteroidales bacterium]